MKHALLCFGEDLGYRMELRLKMLLQAMFFVKG